MARTTTIKSYAHAIRAALKLAGIKALVAIDGSGRSLRVCPPGQTHFTAAQIESVCREAVVLGMTAVARLPINPAHEARLTGKRQWNFHI